MSVHEVRVAIPSDAYIPGRLHGLARCEVIVHCPMEMTPERFREIARDKGARVTSLITSLAPKYGPILDTSWVENGVKVVLHGPVDEEVVAALP